MKPDQINSRKRYSDGLTSGCKLLKKRGNDFYSGRGVRRGKHFESKEANDGQKKIYGNKTYSPFPTLNQTLEHYLALIRRLHCMLGERVSPRALLWHLDMQIDFRARIPCIESDLHLEGVAGFLTYRNRVKLQRRVTSPPAFLSRECSYAMNNLSLSDEVEEKLV